MKKILSVLDVEHGEGGVMVFNDTTSMRLGQANPRPKNDCVVQFFAKSVIALTDNKFNDHFLLGHFASIVAPDWMETNELPVVSQRNAPMVFARAVSKLGLSLSLRIVPFRSIPYGLYFDFAKSAADEKYFIGLGYRSRFIFGGQSNDLHVSSIKKFDEKSVQFDDIDLDGCEDLSWGIIEEASLSGNSGFWLVNLI